MNDMISDRNMIRLRPASPDEIDSIERLNTAWADELFASYDADAPPSGAALPPALRRPISLFCPECPRHRAIVAETRTGIVGMIATLAITRPITAEALGIADESLRAYVEITPPNSLHICGLAVVPAYRRTGVASRLLAVAEIEARALDLPRLSVTLFDVETPACRFFQSAGFRNRDAARRAGGPAPDGPATPDDLGTYVVLEKPVAPHAFGPAAATQPGDQAANREPA